MVATRISRGEKILAQAVNSHKVSETGIKAFLAAVDPFHDTPIEGLRGWPDLETGPSVVRHWKQSTTVKAVEDGGSILIYTWPIQNISTLYRCDRRNGVIDQIYESILPATQIAPLVIYNYSAAQANAASLILNPATQADYLHTINGGYFYDGPSRLIGMGVEVHDVTADLYKQGTCTVFQQNQSVADTESVLVKGMTIGSTPILQTPQDVCRMNRFPSTLADMMLYPTTLQWEARDGAYVVVPFTGHENSALFAEYRTPFVLDDPSLVDVPGALNNSTAYIGDYASGYTTGTNLTFLANCYSPVHSKGVYLSGLNANSTFTITTTFYFESFPSQASPLLPLAAPSSPFDPKALAMISLAFQRLPVGCKVADNPDGEWFWDVLEGALPVLGTVASMIFPEFSPLIAMGTAAGTNALEARKRPKKKKEKAKIKNEVKQEVKKDLMAMSAQAARANIPPQTKRKK